MLITCPICESDKVTIKNATVEKAANGHYTVEVEYECVNEHRWKVTQKSDWHETEQTTKKA